MASSVAKGSRYKARTKAWLESQGYAVAHLEKMHWIFAGGRRIPTKRDQFGCDLLAMRRERLVFVQVKPGSPSEPKSLAKFREFPFTESAQVAIWLVVWKCRARHPLVVDLTAQVLQ